MKKTRVLIGALALSCLITVPAYAAEWKQDSKGWWWQEDNGSYPTSSWKNIGGKSYYFGADGYMLHDTTTPDGYKVGSDGAWIEENKTTATANTEDKPKLKTIMSDKKDSRATSIAISLENLSDSDIIIYGKNSYTKDKDFERYDRRTELTYLPDNGNLVTANSYTLKPGEQKIFLFHVLNDNSTWYDKNTTLNFAIEYKGKGYLCWASSSTKKIVSFEELSRFIDEPITLDWFK